MPWPRTAPATRGETLSPAYHISIAPTLSKEGRALCRMLSTDVICSSETREFFVAQRNLLCWNEIRDLFRVNDMVNNV